MTKWIDLELIPWRLGSRRVLIPLLAGLILLWTRPSEAQSQDPRSNAPDRPALQPTRSPASLEVPPDEPLPKRWYGSQTLTVDAVALGVISLGTPISYGFTVLGFGTYVLGGPIVHATHERYGTAAASLALRVALAYAGGWAAVKPLDHCSEPPDPDDPDPEIGCPSLFTDSAIVGLTLGGAVAAGVDAFALAFEPAKPERRSEHREAPGRCWYGWQTLAADGVAAGLLALSLPASDRTESALLVAGSGAFALGGPAVHAMHQRYEPAIASLGLRVGLALTGYYIGFSEDPDCLDSSRSGACTPTASRLAVGAAAGGVLASLTDAIFLATEPRRYADESSHENAEPQVWLAPRILLAPGSLHIGLQGAL